MDKQHTDPWDCDGPSPHSKKIISYSLYGKDPRYVEGVEANVKLAKEYFPDWTVRIYTDQGEIAFEKEPGLWMFAEHMYDNVEVIVKQKEVGHLGLFWRFEPLDDISIDRFIVRDLDSRLSPREANAVQQWEDSKYSFHIIRDHPQHNVPICGGMWGATSSFIKRFDFASKYKEHLSTLLPLQIFHQRGQYFNTDQPFLWKYVWPLIQDSHMAHIGDFDNLKISGNELPLTTTNPDNSFIGQPM